MSLIKETEVVRACQTLFGDHVDISRDFLFYIQPSGVKSAYRKMAKENHPDLFAADPLPVQQKQTARLRQIIEAYDLLNMFFKQREEGAWKPGVKPFRQSKRAPEQPKPASAAASPGKDENVYYTGTVPHRILQIGQYLYYRGKITFGALISALVWQRKQRPTIGDIAIQWGLMDRDGVNRIFSLCGKPRLFGEKAVELGLLSVFQVNTILLYQRSQQDRLGKYFISNNILTSRQLDELVTELKEHNAGILASSASRRRYHQRAYA